MRQSAMPGVSPLRSLLTASPTVSPRPLLSAFPSPYRMSNWPASRSRRVLAPLERIGWRGKRQRGSHRLLTPPEWPDYEVTFHHQDEIGPRMFARVAKPARVRPQGPLF